ncbi:hypothetical protein AB0A73_04815 [Glycomyces sp. NPDC047369]
MMFFDDYSLARRGQRVRVREFAEAADAFLEDVDPETISEGRALSHRTDRGSVEPGTAVFAISRTRRSRSTRVTARIRIDGDGAISGECDCASAEAVCDHLVGALVKLVDKFTEDEELLMRFQRMTDDQVEAARESRRPGRTRWAATAYTGGPAPGAAFARTVGPLPEPPAAPPAPGAPSYLEDTYYYERHGLDKLEKQAVRAAKAAIKALKQAS